MKRFTLNTLVSALALSGMQTVFAGSDVFFNPLTQSTAVATPNHINELNSPWQTPAGMQQRNLTSLGGIEADPSQSVVRVQGLGTGASMFDMSAFDPSGNYVFIPHETFNGAGLTRYSIIDDTAEVLFSGDLNGANGDWSHDYGALDPATWTPNNTLFLAEEWSGEGRVIEVMNPMADPANIHLRELNSIPNVAHEGLRFSRNGKALYFIDEWNSGAVYKFMPAMTDGKLDYTRGQVFVLVVDAFDGIAADLWNDSSNLAAVRTGPAHWEPMTDENGTPLTTTDPFKNGPSNDPRSNSDTRGGRGAADELNATPFGRPEDVEVGRLANGHGVLYFNATSEKSLYSVEELGHGEAFVRLSASEATTPKNLGYPATTAVLNSPDNLAQDALGNLYIVEDAPNRADVGGDIWFVRDTDNDGVAESLDHFMSLQVDGAESTGMIFNPAHPTQFIVSVQHPDSTDLAAVADGFGDALWLFDLHDIVAPPCNEDEDDDERDGFERNEAHAVNTCTHAMDRSFVKRLMKASRH